MPGPREEPFTFYLDECIDFDLLAEALTRVGTPTVRHRDRFRPGAEDTVWLPVVGAELLVVLTKDRAIRRHELETKAFRNAGVAAFVLRGKNLNGEQIATAFVKALPAMKRYLKKYRRPFMAAVSAHGALTLLDGGATYGGRRPQ